MIQQFHPYIISKRKENIGSRKDLYRNAQRRVIYDSRKLEPIQICPQPGKQINKLWSIPQGHVTNRNRLTETHSYMDRFPKLSAELKTLDMEG